MSGTLAEEVDLVPATLQLQRRAVPLALSVAHPLLGAGDSLARRALGRGGLLPRGTRRAELLFSRGQERRDPFPLGGEGFDLGIQRGDRVRDVARAALSFGDGGGDSLLLGRQPLLLRDQPAAALNQASEGRALVLQPGIGTCRLRLT